MTISTGGRDNHQDDRRELLRVRVRDGAASAELAAGVTAVAANVIGFTEREQHEIEQTVGALARDVVEHHFDDPDDADFTLTVIEEPAAIRVRLEDAGLPYAVDRIQFGEGTLTGQLTDRPGHHDLRIEHHGDRGNALEVDFPRSAESQAHLADQPDLGHEAVADDHPVVIRALEAGDAESLARCIYRCYGYTYAREWVYLPDEVRRRMGDGTLQAVVGIDDAGEVVGHQGLLKEHPGDRVVESGIVVVDPRFRGHHLLRSMKKKTNDELRQRTDIVGYHADAVAVHRITQKANVDLGGTEIGLLVDEVPGTTEFRGLEQKPGARNSTVIYFHLTGTPEPISIYAPPGYRDLLADMYQRTGLPRRLEAPEPATGKTRMHAELQRKRNLARMTVDRAGDDMIDLVRQHLHEFNLGHVDVVQIDLPLADAGATDAVEGLRDLGFGFAALFPERHVGDVLRLQYLHDLEIDPEAMDLYSDEARNLLAVIQADLTS